MKFRDYFSPKQMIFSACVVALMLLFAVRQSNNVVRVTFYDNSIFIKATRYTMDIPYEEIESAELTALAEAGEEVVDTFDDDTVRVGVWNNQEWGDYHACIDPDTSNCVVIRHDDGRIFVFSCKNDTKTEKLYSELLTRLN